MAPSQGGSKYLPMQLNIKNIKQHRTVSGTNKKEIEPEYQQLMQLLSDDDSHLAQTHEAASSVDR